MYHLKAQVTITEQTNVWPLIGALIMAKNEAQRELAESAEDLTASLTRDNYKQAAIEIEAMFDSLLDQAYRIQKESAK